MILCYLYFPTKCPFLIKLFPVKNIYRRAVSDMARGKLREWFVRLEPGTNGKNFLVVYGIVKSPNTSSKMLVKAASFMACLG